MHALAAENQFKLRVVGVGGGEQRDGLDLNELGDSGTNFDGRFIEAVRDLPQPTIAAIEGPAVTGGLELALACDIRIASASARLADTHARVGVLPGSGASVLLQRLNTGHWDSSALQPSSLNAAAAALGPTLNVFSSGSTLVPTAPAFLTFHPTQYLRPFDRPVP